MRTKLVCLSVSVPFPSLPAHPFCLCCLVQRRFFIISFQPLPSLFFFSLPFSLISLLIFLRYDYPDDTLSLHPLSFDTAARFQTLVTLIIHSPDYRF